MRFGSIGLPLEGISTRLTIARAAETTVEGKETARILDHLAKLGPHLGLSGHHRIVVHEAIPDHAGLGSGTQLALAVSAALRTLHGLPFDVSADAVFLGRGTRSGIGVAAFEEGGLILDAGKGSRDQTPTVISRQHFPEEWRAILVFDGCAQGIHGEAEISAFRELPSFPATSSAAICRHVLMGIMPALIEKDILAFGDAVTAIQREVGNYFAPAQGGLFTSPAVEATLTQLAAAGAVGIGQSSWGPTGFAFAASQAAAERIIAAARPEAGTTIRILGGRNGGAKIIRSVTPPRFAMEHERHN
ncbi:beta-ribofuranosylaminobenzene 5'-phosphate synthase family protein [Sinorhizobium sp. BG8]|uniref:beta-ribofuranosylaminobenzene 5'-phosphate synthase family protein n=1 Tax=Sinorhizobium sp. BG8 TaxID=2613773 RepID=UPI0032B14C40